MESSWGTLVAALGRAPDRLRARFRADDIEALLSAALSRLPVAVWSTDHDLRLTSFQGGALPRVYREATAFLGRPLHEMLGLGYVTAMDAHHRARAGEPTEFELLWRGRLFQGFADPWPGHDGRSGARAVVLDVTDKRRAEEKLRHAVLHDPVTGLPNRTLFLDRVRQAMARARRSPEHAFGLLVLDLDRFKGVNDGLGHLAGDDCLAAVAARVAPCVRPQDTLAHLGGDQFAVLVEDLGETSDLVRVADRFRAALTRPVTIRGQEVSTSATIGIAPGAPSYTQAEALLRDAHAAMHRAKLQGPGAFQVFDDGMHARALARLRLETELRRAIERSEFRLHYQPIVSLATGRLAAFEGLLRWEHPDRGLLAPDDFLPLAEETGMILPLGQWALQEGCRQTREWRDALGQSDLPTMSLNLSGRQLIETDLVSDVSRTLETAGLAGHELDLEVTENIIMADADSTRGCLAGLRAMDLGVSIDDFGTGHSSLSHLDRLPVDTLKIDRSFLHATGGHPQKTEIVRTIVGLGHSLGLEVIAEGVETKDQLAQLREMGCDHGQGYFFAPPVDAAAARVILQSA
jgi:diguanylate cyclase (GGDEF)-like protein